MVFDARYVRMDYHDGISRYSMELGNALAKITPVTLLISHPAQAALFPDAVGSIIAPHPESWREVFTARLINRNGGADVVFSPLQTLGSWKRKFGLILTLQDLIYHRQREAPPQLRRATRLLWRAYHWSYLPQKLTINRADVVATVSQTSKQEIVAARLTRKRIVVLSNAPRQFPNAQVTQHDAPPKNLIYMGALMRYKNPETLIRAMVYLPERVLHILSRGSAERMAELRTLVPHGCSVVFHNGVTDEEYLRLLEDDAILVTATKDEGFGLPPAEALALGVPVVVSDIPVLHEVVGAGGEFFDQEDPLSFADAVRRLDNRDHRSRLIARGAQHLTQFSWAKSAEVLMSEAKRLHESQGRAR